MCLAGYEEVVATAGGGARGLDDPSATTSEISRPRKRSFLRKICLEKSKEEGEEEDGISWSTQLRPFAFSPNL